MKEKEPPEVFTARRRSLQEYEKNSPIGGSGCRWKWKEGRTPETGTVRPNINWFVLFQTAWKDDVLKETVTTCCRVHATHRGPRVSPAWRLGKRKGSLLPLCEVVQRDPICFCRFAHAWVTTVFVSSRRGSVPTFPADLLTEENRCAPMSWKKFTCN